jgi:syntaxin-binding protein 1
LDQSVTAKLAKRLQLHLDEYKKREPNFPRPTAYDYQGPSTMIIVDRSMDLVSPLIHSLGYQAALYDIKWTDVKEQEIKFEELDGLPKLVAKVKGPSGKTLTVVLDESDELFVCITTYANTDRTNSNHISFLSRFHL